jgi:cytoskeletal protein CcmA (bactofilin family)
MREERGNIRGNLVVDEPYTLWGSIAGDVTAVKGSKFYVRGMIYGSLTVLHGGRVHVYGNITGNLVVKDGAKVIHSGVVGGDAINEGGRLYVDKIAKVLGDVKSEEGSQTVIESENPDRPEVE